MSRISETLRNKHKIETARKIRRKNELANLRSTSAYKAKLYDELKHIDTMLEDDDIEAVIITIDDKMLAQFNTALYSEDLVGYDVKQDSRIPNKFYIRRKYVAF